MCSAEVSNEARKGHTHQLQHHAPPFQGKVFIKANDGSGEYVLETQYKEAVKFQRGNMEV